jgi:hypothetical protein
MDMALNKSGHPVGDVKMRVVLNHPAGFDFAQAK